MIIFGLVIYLALALPTLLVVIAALAAGSQAEDRLAHEEASPSPPRALAVPNRA